MEERQVRRASLDDAYWMVDLCARVQAALTASGSLQQIGPLSLEGMERSICAENAYVLEVAGQRLGSVLIDSLDDFRLVRWGMHRLPGPLWYLHTLMLEPEVQGKRLGLTFLEGVKRFVLPARGTIVLDCWAGNANLRDFYLRAGFTFYRVFPVKDFEVAVFFYSVVV